MKHSKLTRTLSLVLALIMSFSLLTTAFAMDDETQDDELPLIITKFTDVASTAWYYADVTECAKLGIVAGFDDNTFRPNDNVTDTQFITMLTRTFYASKLDAVVTPAGQSWYYPNVKVATDTGMLKNVTITNKNMSRYNMAMVLGNIIDANGKRVATTTLIPIMSEIKDMNVISTNYKTYTDAILQCYYAGIIGGIDGKFCGDQNMTRAQACTVIVRMMKLINNYNPGDADNLQYDDGTTQVNKNTLANGKPITEANVLEILEQLKKEYPTGKIWSSNTRYTPDPKLVQSGRQTDITVGQSTYRSVFGSVSMVTACGGFAALVSDRIFGLYDHPMREITDPSKIRAGDILVYVNEKGSSSHVGVATSNARKTTTLYGETVWVFTTADGNINSQIAWSTGNSYIDHYSNGNPMIRVFTRYPD